MICNVIIEKEKNSYIARSKDWPEIVATETSRDKAISSIRLKLADFLTKKIDVIQIDVPVPTETGNPWIDKFGYFKNDPTFDNLEMHMVEYRRGAFS